MLVAFTSHSALHAAIQIDRRDIEECLQAHWKWHDSYGQMPFPFEHLPIRKGIVSGVMAKVLGEMGLIRFESDVEAQDQVSMLIHEKVGEFIEEVQHLSTDCFTR